MIQNPQWRWYKDKIVVLIFIARFIEMFVYSLVEIFYAYFLQRNFGRDERTYGGILFVVGWLVFVLLKIEFYF